MGDKCLSAQLSQSPWQIVLIKHQLSLNPACCVLGNCIIIIIGHDTAVEGAREWRKLMLPPGLCPASPQNTSWFRISGF